VRGLFPRVCHQRRSDGQSAFFKTRSAGVRTPSVGPRSRVMRTRSISW